MTDLDFSNPGAATRINSWASKETHGRISKVIDRIDPADLALLLNAVYFKGQWAHKFDKAQTQQRDFTLADGSVKQVVLQSTYWKVDEEGAEAAAVTTTGVRAAAVARPEQPFRMIVDQPFFCAIEDRRSGALLFIGAIYDPAT